MKRNKYNFNNRFVVINTNNDFKELEKYADKLFFETVIGGELIKVYTAKEHDYNTKHSCECGNLSNDFTVDYDNFQGTTIKRVVCPFCIGIKRGLKFKTKNNKLQMKALKYKGKSDEKWRKFLIKSGYKFISEKKYKKEKEEFDDFLSGF